MIFKYWDDKCVVYHPVSGDVHLLSTVHAKLLEALRAESDDQSVAEQMKKHHAIHQQFVSDRAMTDWVSANRQEFEKLHLLD